MHQQTLSHDCSRSARGSVAGDADLAAFDRGRTPWLVVGMHAPWYNTYAAHYQEAECFRLAVEELLYDAGADLIFAGAEVDCSEHRSWSASCACRGTPHIFRRIGFLFRT